MFATGVLRQASTWSEVGIYSGVYVIGAGDCLKIEPKQLGF